MRWRLPLGLVVATQMLGAAAAPPARAPRIAATSALSALPVELADGKSGPINRYAFELSGFAAGDDASVVCIYNGGLTYRCAHEIAAAQGALVRVVVEIPDLDRGHEVRVRFVTRAGMTSATVRLTNGPRLVHEIETVALTEGGALRAGGDGGPASVSHLLQQLASTVPSLAVQGPGEVHCDDIFAKWESAEVTNPVFLSELGALHGGITQATPVRRGARVDEQHLPQWLVTYPRSATRVQFIAHYEVSYRVGICPERIVG
jgi:hypothetical protein